MPLRAEKEELAKALSERLGLSQRASRRLLNGVLDLLIERMRADGQIALWGFGKFKVVEPRRYSNPQIGRRLDDADRTKTVTFRPSRALRSRLD